MKTNRIYLTTILFFLTLGLFAQEYEGISIAKRYMSQGTNNSYLIELADVSRDEAVDEWEKFVKPYRGKTKYNRKTEEFVTTDATVPGMGATTLYAKIVEEKTDPAVKATIILWFETADRGFAGEQGETTLMDTGASLAQRYASLTSKAHANNALDTEQRHLADLQKELKDLRRDREKYQEATRDAEQIIEEMRKKLGVNAVDIETREAEITEQTKAVKRAEDNVRKAGM